MKRLPQLIPIATFAVHPFLLLIYPSSFIPHPLSLVPAKDPVDGRQQVCGTDRLGLEIIHSGSEAALAVLFPGPRRQGNDGQVSSRGQLSLPNCLDDLEAVQLRHVNVQEQQVKTPLLRQRKHVTAVARQPDAMSLPDECLLQDLRAQLIVFRHENVQGNCRLQI